MVVLQGATLRKGKGKIQENDFVIVDYEWKVIFCIESKATLNHKTGQNAVKQTLELKKLLEEYFASELASGEWAFVGMIFTSNNKKSICQACTPFVIQGCSEVAAELVLVLEDYLEPIRGDSVPQTTRSTLHLFADLSLWYLLSRSAPTAPSSAMSLTRWMARRQQGRPKPKLARETSRV